MKIFWLILLSGGILLPLLAKSGCQDAPSNSGETQTMKHETQSKSNAEWKCQLTPQQYRVTRLGETEAPFTGMYWETKDEGTYVCVCCGEPLYSSKTKFDSGTGWPSFWDAVKQAKIEVHTDTSHGMVRQELRCGNCGAHLGHVFNDGPEPTGKRHCINSAALRLEPKESRSQKR